MMTQKKYNRLQSIADKIHDLTDEVISLLEDGQKDKFMQSYENLMDACSVIRSCSEEIPIVQCSCAAYAWRGTCKHIEETDNA